MTSLDGARLPLLAAAGQNLPISLRVLGWGLLLLSIAAVFNLRAAMSRARSRGESWRDAAKSEGASRIAILVSFLLLGIPLSLDLPLVICQICGAVMVAILLVDTFGARLPARKRDSQATRDRS